MNKKLKEFIGRLKTISSVSSSETESQTIHMTGSIPSTESSCDRKSLSVEDDLRAKRAEICFPIVNRGQVWYDTLTTVQRAELLLWYQSWLDVTKTLQVPKMPCWIK